MGVTEIVWTVQDLRNNLARPLFLTELLMPEVAREIEPSLLRKATRSFLSAGRHAQMPTLIDVFAEAGRNFFVFDGSGIETVANRCRRMGNLLSEQDALQCMVQIIEQLQLLAQEFPPLVHGLIRPEHIRVDVEGQNYFLHHPSLVFAGEVPALWRGIEPGLLTPYSVPELGRTAIDERIDIYSLLATIYHLTTGHLPVPDSGSGFIAAAQQSNPALSASFSALLGRGLHVMPEKRFQALVQVHLAIKRLQIELGSGQQGAIEWGEQSPIVTSQAPTSSSASAPSDLLTSNIKGRDKERAMLLKNEDLPRPQKLSFLLAWIIAIVVFILVLALMSSMLR
ncbi:hypothetical protein KTT_17380 [Tengunoibacter tsumagoiensis]|uniref:Protein kinase domain-containing protein n=1 Tax=Tengunoibacter tsumagoiensis TaxID=2014871 RepID=A0A401ZYF2_9CHLR|nr:hypothetical protein KTT_17380 [Tengunoibacter tsumagoiensis]